MSKSGRFYMRLLIQTMEINSRSRHTSGERSNQILCPAPWGTESVMARNKSRKTFTTFCGNRRPPFLYALGIACLLRFIRWFSSYSHVFRHLSCVPCHTMSASTFALHVQSPQLWLQLQTHMWHNGLEFHDQFLDVSPPKLHM